MIAATFNDKDIVQLLAMLPKEAARAAEISLDKTVDAAQVEIKAEMERVFDRPNPHTLKSPHVTHTRNHNMQASVWIADPLRMTTGYLLPQVEGGKRNLKGFERALGNMPYIPSRDISGRGVKLDKYGNVSMGQIRQLLSVLKLAESSAGFSSNITSRSAKRNKKDRDYVWLPQGSGKMPPGVYQRVQTAVGYGAKTKRTIGKFGAFQQGTRKVAVRDKNGRIVRWDTPRSKIQSIVMAKGLKPILIAGHHNPVKPLLDFYGIAGRVFDRQFKETFITEFEALIK